MNAIQHILIFGVRLYQVLVSPLKVFLFGPLGRCRFDPSCSEYALEAIRTHGGFGGSWLALKRIARCHPWGGCGCDPVPEKPQGFLPHTGTTNSGIPPFFSLSSLGGESREENPPNAMNSCFEPPSRQLLKQRSSGHPLLGERAGVRGNGAFDLPLARLPIKVHGEEAIRSCRSVHGRNISTCPSPSGLSPAPR